MVPLLQVNGRQMLPKFDVPKCHCASFLKYGVYIQYVQYILHQIWHSGKIFSWIEFRRVNVLYNLRFSDWHSKIMCMLTKIAPQHLALSVKSTTGNTVIFLLIQNFQICTATNKIRGPLGLFLLMRKKQLVIKSASWAVVHVRVEVVVLYKQDHQNDWCYNRLKIVLYP
jgi:hypothetical protein